MFSENSITILIDTCTDCGSEMQLRQVQEYTARNWRITAICPTCGAQVHINLRIEPEEE